MTSASSMHEIGHSKLFALGQPRGMQWGSRWEGDSGWGTHAHPWQIHVAVLQNQYNIVK